MRSTYELAFTVFGRGPPARNFCRKRGAAKTFFLFAEQNFALKGIRKFLVERKEREETFH